jgi:hypothetical protein
MGIEPGSTKSPGRNGTLVLGEMGNIVERFSEWCSRLCRPQVMPSPPAVVEDRPAQLWGLFWQKLLIPAILFVIKLLFSSTTKEIEAVSWYYLRCINV